MDLWSCFTSRKKPGSIATNPNPSSEKLDLLHDEGSAVQNDLWQLCFREKLKEWDPKDRVFLEHLHDEDLSQSPERCLEYLSRKYAEQGVSKYRSRIKIVLETVEPFITAVNTMVQSDQIASLVWGGLTVIFWVSSGFAVLSSLKLTCFTACSEICPTF